MAQILVRGLSDEVIERLRRRAEDSHRSLEAEVREILEREGRSMSRRRFVQFIDDGLAEFNDSPLPSSTPGIAEDRER